MPYKFLLILTGIFLAYYLLATNREMRKKRIRHIKRRFNLFFYLFLLLYAAALYFALTSNAGN